MKPFFRKPLHQLLALAHRKLVYLPKGKVSGFDLDSDLRQVIPHAHPVCLDVGANEGQTITWLQTVLNEPVIHAFEPARQTFAALQAKSFGAQTHLHNFALGKEAGQREFTNYSVSLLNSFLPLASGAENPLRGMKAESREMVEIKSLDEFLDAQTFGVIDLLKIDTQGFELEVLLGAEKSFRAQKIRHVLVELNFIPLYDGQSPAREVDAILSSHGFHLVDYYEKFREGHKLAWCTAFYTSGKI